MTSNNSKPILKVYFINNEYLSSCNICLYNIPKKEAKNGLYQYNFAFPKFKLGKEKYNVKVSVLIPEDKFDTFFKYGIMQKNQLSYCEVSQNREATFSMNVWLYTCEESIIGKAIKVKENKMRFSASVNRKIKTNKKPIRKTIKISSSSSRPVNFVSLSYVPKRSVKGRANLFRPYQGGSWTPR